MINRVKYATNKRMKISYTNVDKLLYVITPMISVLCVIIIASIN